QFSQLVVGCSIPFTLTDNQMPAGESTYYILYIGNPATGGIEVGKFVGKTNAINISPELYDILKDNTDEEFYVVKEVLYNDDTLRSSAVRMPGQHFTVTETSFLFSEAGFNGDCVTVSKDQSVNLNQTGYDFDNKLSSMLVQGNVWVVLYPQANYGGYSQAFFTDEDSYAHIRDFDEMIIGSKTVSSIKVREKWHGVYTFDGPDFSGSFDLYNDEQFARDSGGHQANDWMGYQRGDVYFKKDDSISSVKVVGPYAAALYENYNWSGAYALVKENYGGPNLNSNIDNKASSISVFHGEGVWLFDIQTYRGNYKRFLPVDANTPYNCRHSSNECGFPGDTLSSVLVIGDYGVTLYEHPDYNGRVQAVKTFDQYSGSSGDVGDNLMSSFRVFPKGVYLGQELNFTPGRSIIVKDPGEYRYIESIQILGNNIQDNSLSSIFIVGDYKVTLYTDPVFQGNTLEMYGWLGDFRSHPIGNDTISSLKIEEL
ncbi:beta/gamma crystallin-related protein, partial [Chengkuizengella marina]